MTIKTQTIQGKDRRRRTSLTILNHWLFPGIRQRQKVTENGNQFRLLSITWKSCKSRWEQKPKRQRHNVICTIIGNYSVVVLVVDRKQRKMLISCFTEKKDDIVSRILFFSLHWKGVLELGKMCSCTRYISEAESGKTSWRILRQIRLVSDHLSMVRFIPELDIWLKPSQSPVPLRSWNEAFIRKSNTMLNSTKWAEKRRVRG